jgi:hypothetical protein
VNAKLINGAIFYTETINSGGYVRLILTEIFAQLTGDELSYAWFLQDWATARTADSSVKALGGAYGQHAHLILPHVTFIYGLFVE